MAKHRKRTLPPAPPAPEAKDVSQERQVVNLVIAGFLIALAIYLVLFYRREVVPGFTGFQRLLFLLLPDQLVGSWCGGEFGEVQVLDRLGPSALFTAISLVAALLGWLLLDLLRLRSVLDCIERFALAMGLGLSGLSLFALVIGLAGGIRQPLWFAALALVVVSVHVWRIWRQRQGSTADDRHRSDEPAAVESNEPGRPESLSRARWYRPRWWWAAVPFAVAILAGAVLPPVDFDVLEYHLQVPKQWFLQGRVTFMPYNIYGNMPLGSEMLSTLAMVLAPGDLDWWWGALGGKLVMASYALLTTLLLFAAGRRYYSPRAGAIAALIYISTAWVADVSQSGLNEAAVGFYLFAGFYVGKRWWDQTRGGCESQVGLLVLCGLLAGSAVACKYTSLLLVVVPLTVVVVLASRVGRFKHAALFLLALAITCGPWLGKNWALAGNPTYPLLYRLFGGETRTPEKDAQWRRAHAVPPYSVSEARSALVGLLTDWRQNPLIFPCMALLALRGRRNRDIGYWALLSGFVLLAWWLATHRLHRFWVPAIPLLALLAGVGATWTESRSWRRVIEGVLAVMLVANFISVTAPGLTDNRYLVSLVQLRDDPRLSFTTHRSIALQYLRNQVPDGSRALVVGDAALFAARVPVLYNTCFDDCRFESIFRGRSVTERRAKLAELGISHVYIDWAELSRYRQPGNYGYSSYVTHQLVQEELVERQQLLRRVHVPDLDPALAEMYRVVPLSMR